MSAVVLKGVYMACSQIVCFSPINSCAGCQKWIYLHVAISHLHVRVARVSAPVDAAVELPLLSIWGRAHVARVSEPVDAAVELPLLSIWGPRFLVYSPA